MKPFFKSVLLSSLLSLFIFGDLAMGQKRYYDRNMRMYYIIDPETGERAYEPGVGRNQRISNNPAPDVTTKPQYQPQPQRQSGNLGNSYNSTNRGTTTRGTSGNASRYWRLTPGDVILSVNGEDITGMKSLTNAVNRSPQTMHFTVHDGGRGKIYHFETTLASTGHRFGVYSTDNPGGGARITSVMSNSAARRCILVE